MGLCKKSHIGNVVCSYCGFGLFSYKEQTKAYLRNFFQQPMSKDGNKVIVGEPVKENSIKRIPHSSGHIQIACGKCEHVIGEEQNQGPDASNKKYTFLEGSVKYIPWKF